jgi:drug/metabolite transporter (DMT)-like permease
MRGSRAWQGREAIGFALIAAVLFGLSTPAAKLLLAVADPWLSAGLLYMGSGLFLGGVRLLQRVSGRRPKEAALQRADLPWLAGAILTGGAIAPVLLMFGLTRQSASQTSLLLNLEGVLTALIAWGVFREHIDRRIAAGMGLITAGAVALAWTPGQFQNPQGALLVAAACLAWAIDNNFTRKVSGGDPILIAAVKGGAAGAANFTIAMASGVPLPGGPSLLVAAVIGALGYGVSLALFVRALRDLGAARTGAYFSTAPFVGTIASIAALGEPLTVGLAVGGALMGIGVWLHVSERHYHEHLHDELAHEHLHRHDEHHQHAHEPGTPSAEPHSHRHGHVGIRHAHPHYPDIHHRHGH